MDLDEEQHDAQQREASAAGLMVGVLLLFLAGASLIGAILFWPAIQAASPAPPTPPQGIIAE